LKRPLRDLSRGDVFRTADGLLWRREHSDEAADPRWCSPLGRDSDMAPLPSDLEVEPLDLPALLTCHAGLEKENAELRAVLHDLWQDRTAARAGAELERGAVVAFVRSILNAERGRAGEPADYGRGWREGAVNVLEALLPALEALGPARPPVPPCALEGAVREAITVLEAARRGLGSLAFDRDAGLIDGALARLRAALGEG
jgi:hypothetical protein